MAAELLLTFTMEETLKRVISIAAEGIRLAWGLEGQLQRLNKSLTMIQVVLQDAARRVVTDESVKLWLERLQDVAYDAEDVLDEFADLRGTMAFTRGAICQLLLAVWHSWRRINAAAGGDALQENM